MAFQQSRSARSMMARLSGTFGLGLLSLCPLLPPLVATAQAGQQPDATSTASSSGWQTARRADIGQGLYELVWSPSMKALLVAGTNGFGNDKGGTVYRLNPQTLAVEQQWTLPYKAFSLALNDRTHTLYIGHSLDQAVSALNLDSGDIRTLKLTTPSSDGEDGNSDERKGGAHPREMVVDPATDTLYIDGVADDSVVWQVNGRTMTLERALTGFGQWSTGMALDDDAHRLYVATYQDNAVRVVNTDSGEVEARWPTGGENPLNLALDAPGHRLFVTHAKSNAVSVIDTQTGKIVDRIDTGAGSLAVKFNADRDRLFVTHRDAHRVSIFDARDYTRLGQLNFDRMPNSLAVMPAGNTAWVSLKQPLNKQHKAEGPDGVARLTP